MLKKISPSPFEVKPYSKRELSHLYSVCNKTFSNWLEPFQHEIGKRNGRFYTVKQVDVIIDKLGLPHYYADDKE
jgi:hypothetical protein